MRDPIGDTYSYYNFLRRLERREPAFCLQRCQLRLRDQSRGCLGHAVLDLVRSPFALHWNLWGAGALVSGYGTARTPARGRAFESGGPEEQRKLISFLVALDLRRDEGFREELQRRIDDRDPNG